MKIALSIVGNVKIKNAFKHSSDIQKIKSQ